jgi:hypothetical protein
MQSKVVLPTCGAVMIDKIYIADILSNSPSGGMASEPSGSPVPEATVGEISDYIADMLQELRDLSSASGQSALGMLLELAQREARRNAVRAISVNSLERPPLTG